MILILFSDYKKKHQFFYIVERQNENESKNRTKTKKHPQIAHKWDIKLIIGSCDIDLWKPIGEKFHSNIIAVMPRVRILSRLVFINDAIAI